MMNWMCVCVIGEKVDGYIELLIGCMVGVRERMCVMMKGRKGCMIWMSGWMGRWMGGWVDGWVDGWMGDRMYEGE